MRLFTPLLAAVLLTVSGASLASTPEQAVTEALKQKLGITADSVTVSPVSGLYEALTSQGIFYVTADGSKLIHGQIYDLDSGMKNLTEARMSKVRLDLLDQVKGTAIEFKAKDEKHVVYAFTDITCGYCRKLHNEIEQYNDLGITVRYLAFPRGGERNRMGQVNPSWKDMQNVWCAKNPQAAMTAAKAGDKVPDVTCASGETVQRHYALGNTMGVTGTPALVLDDGTILPGYLPPSRLLQALETQ
ncbi:bifunctional protein-disulfide isomerase/oxidoreductase DsbC [Ferrimonas balearica]|uniref:bifunctional protein-disulfide isomerase/oxidoreductase DsbC n=1 Tax=Ferrimonas balearica TaxID=44012 RepID=UPI001C98FEE6|nr:bifunctional protein-disulfide isomerase/oxidoreductase DsbC [Ferrimonas balearica]MBY5921681.1 bifunctional protein-disulfide isomerase/oxidoreductase DsbC [Ferrimonas balearica]MBY5994979.1 bifunctional protein-disulfide isomerase/oxidoreductase DsbC [Ferrimonas balearica]